jgi:preprotein translocase subunit YajC
LKGFSVLNGLNFLAIGAPGPGGSPLMTFAPLVLMVVVFYFLLIRPQQKKQKAWAEMLSKLKAGDRVTTTGGIRGTILAVKDDTLQLQVPPDRLRIEVVKTAIASVTPAGTEE